MTDTATLAEEKARYIKHVGEFRAGVFVPGTLNRIREFVHDDVIDHFAPKSDAPGIDGFMKRFTAAQGAIKGLSIEVLASAYDGDLLFQVIQMNLKHTGDFMGMPATGKTFSIGGFDAFKFRDNKIAEHWGVYDVSKIPDLLVEDGGVPGAWSAMWPQQQ
jgi:predicted ester cyclase